MGGLGRRGYVVLDGSPRLEPMKETITTGLLLLTCDVARYRDYLPAITPIAP